MPAPKKKEKVCRWFVETEDDHTNLVLANMVMSLQSSEASCHEDLQDADGKPIRAWEVPFSIVTQMKNSSANLKLRFKVYNCWMGDGRTVRLWQLPKKKTSPQAKATKARLRRLAQKLRMPDDAA